MTDWQESWEQAPDPKIQDDLDAIVRIDTVTICRTDLHILEGEVPEVSTAGSWVTKRSARSTGPVSASDPCARAIVSFTFPALAI